MGRWRLLLAGLCAAAALLAATPVSANPPGREGGAEAQPANVSGEIELPPDGEHEISLTIASDDLVKLSVVRLLQPELGAYARAYYAVRPETPLSSGTLRAQFGSIGRVTLRFHPRNRELGRISRRCEGRRPVIKSGIYHGAIELRGEDGYFEATTRRARGTWRRGFPLACDRGHARQPAAGPLESYVTPGLGVGYGHQGLAGLLWAELDTDGRSVAFRAANYELGPRFNELSAGVLESQPEMAIGRSTQALSPVGLLEITPGTSGRTASILPAGPFFGKGSYDETFGTAPIWSGTFGVSLPGLIQPLTGPGFIADLCDADPALGQSCALPDLEHGFLR
jgi:hypothetical protein